MNSKLNLISTIGMSRQDWLGYRRNGLGASEIAPVLGLSQYKSSVELFYEKIGEVIPLNIENIHMFMGKEQEDFIANMWQYWGGSEESLIENFRNDAIQRKCQKVNAYVNNPDYPWLFVSLDRKINKHEGKDEGALEIKTITGYEQDKWESGVPMAHIVQVQTQMLVCMFEYGELCTLRDGRRFEVIPFEYSKEIGEEVIDKTHDFWQKVERGRILITQRFEAERNFNNKAAEELTAELATLEPAPDNSEAYANYMKVKYGRSTEGERAGTIIELDHARSHKNTKEQIKQLTEDNRLHENTLKNSIGEMQKIDFGKDGYVSWKSDTNGVRRFLNKTK